MANKPHERISERAPLMQIIVLVAAIFSIYRIQRYSLADAALHAWLPMLMLTPIHNALVIPHLPPLSLQEGAAFPIGIAFAFSHWREWKFRRIDLWVALFFLGLFYSEMSNTSVQNAGLMLVHGIGIGLLPYLFGKALIEQKGNREAFVRLFIQLGAFVAIVSLWEFRMGRNLFTMVVGFFFPNQHAMFEQIRGGFVRVAGPWEFAEVSGLMFAMAFLFGVWYRFNLKQRGIAEKKYLGIHRSTILALINAAGVYMTLSRGPELGTIFGLVILNVGLVTKVKRTAIITIIVCTLGGTIGYIKAQEYTAGDLFSAKTQEQENAIYRRMLLDNYKPIVEKGGVFGYGVVNFPRAEGQSSIDNAFLYFQVTQGKFGLWMFILMNAEGLLSTVLFARKASNRSDRAFALCIGGGIACILLTVTTVWLGGPSFPLLFLLLGWSQSLRSSATATTETPAGPAPRYRFRRVLA